MELIIKGTPREIAALTMELQGRQGGALFVPETSEGPCYGMEKVATGASCTGNPTHPCQGTSTHPL